MNHRTLLLLLACLLPCCHARERPIPEVAFEGPDSIGSYLQAYLDAPGGPPSISIAVAVDGEIVLAEARGLSDVAGEVAATPETTYRAYSMAKGLTAVGVMQLVEDGKLSLDDEIRAHVPAYPAKPWPIALRHLLTHTSGIRHYKKNAGEISSTIEYPTLADAVGIFGDDPLEFEPGTSYRYTSFGFNLLTGAIESASGKGFGDYLEREIFEPAGMRHSSLAVAGESEATATAYWSPRGRRRPAVDELPNVSGRYGSSGLVTTPSDLVRLFVALGSGELLATETTRRMFDVPFPKVAEDQGLGWNVTTENGRRVIYRTGAGTGYTGIVEYFPDHGVAGAVLINQNQYKGRVPILERVLEHYLRQRD